ncbi:GDSL-type esterase/lipase family protein [Luedemannella flava]
MRKRSAIQAFLAALVLALGYLVVQTVVSAPAASAATPVKVMPLGDSITGNPGCWRALLWNKLVSAGYTNIDFVGTQPAQGCGVSHDGDNEGHGGYLATNVANQNMLPPWLAATTPDIVIMHFGTNDVWSNIAPSTILAAFTTMVNQMRASNPNMRILVAKIIPVAPGTCGDCPARTVAFNDAIPRGRRRCRRRSRRSRSSTSGPAGSRPPTPTTACTRPTRRASRRWPTTGTPRSSPRSAA